MRFVANIKYQNFGSSIYESAGMRSTETDQLGGYPHYDGWDMRGYYTGRCSNPTPSFDTYDEGVYQGWKCFASESVTDGTYNIHDVIITSSSQSGKFGDSSWQTWTTAFNPYGWYTFRFDTYNADYGVDMYVDWVYVRKYVSSEPTITLGAEQPVSTPTPTPTPTPTATPTPTPTTPALTTPALTTVSPAAKQPLLTVSQTSLLEEPEVGEEVLITVTLQNTGEATAKNIRLTEQIPSSISVSFVDGANKPGNLVTWEGELAPNRAHAITHTLKILEKKNRAIPVIIRYEDGAGNQKETSTTVIVGPTIPATPSPTKLPENLAPAPTEIKVKAPGFAAPMALAGLVLVVLLARRR